jgi:hypothetical protein
MTTYSKLKKELKRLGTKSIPMIKGPPNPDDWEGYDGDWEGFYEQYDFIDKEDKIHSVYFFFEVSDEMDAYARDYENRLDDGIEYAFNFDPINPEGRMVYRNKETKEIIHEAKYLTNNLYFQKPFLNWSQETPWRVKE